MSTARFPDVAAPPWAQWPASHLLFALFALIVFAYAIVIDRTFLIDQQNYVDNFSHAANLDWMRSLAAEGSLARGFVLEVFSEELLWRLWATALGSLVDPVTAVLVTVCVLNLLIVASTWKLSGAPLALALWMILPVGFSVTGLLQLRQGFALAIMLFLALRLRRPVLGTLVAAMVHTTFAIAFVFALIGWLLRDRYRLALVAAVLVAFAGAYLGGIVFEMFGGRRLLLYSVHEGATSINYVFGGLLSILPSLYWLVTAGAESDNLPRIRLLSTLALVHVGATAFTLFSFFVFPLGAGRIGYLTQLMLIPILPSISRNRVVGGAIFALLLIYLVYLTGKSYQEGVYDIFFTG